jgi:hypothetical protein
MFQAAWFVEEKEGKGNRFFVVEANRPNCEKFPV